MKKLISIALIAITCFTTQAQKKAVLEMVNRAPKSNHQLPVIILPQMALKLNMAIVEYTYTRGDLLNETIKISNGADPACIAKALAPLAELYELNPNILASFLKSNTQKTFVTYKLDKDFKHAFVPMADYDKIFRYKSPKAVNTSLLNLEYDDNGVLLNAKASYESKLIPGLISVVSGIAGIKSSLRGAGFTGTGTDTTKVLQSKECTITIKLESLNNINDLLKKNDELISNTGYSIEKPFLLYKEKLEEKIKAELEKLFYKKEVKVIPVELTYLIPKDKATIPVGNKPYEIKLFSFDKNNGKIILNKTALVTNNLLYTPFNRVDSADNIENAYTLQLRMVPQVHDPYEGLGKYSVDTPSKITAVFNIPRREGVSLLKPGGNDIVFDTIVKIPQHGKLGFYSARLSTIDLTYDQFGVIKKSSLERKSAFDTNIASGGTAAKDFTAAMKKPDEKTELEKLEEQAKKLELLKKIKDLETQEEL